MKIISLVFASLALSGCISTTGGEYFSCNLNASAVLNGDYNNARVNCNAHTTIRSMIK